MDDEMYAVDIHHGGRGRTKQEPKRLATGGFSLPGGECNDRGCGCALHLCAAFKPQCEHSSDQDYRDSAGAVYQIFSFTCSKHTQCIHLSQ